MKTTLHVIPVDGPIETREVTFKTSQPSTDALHKLIDPLLGDLPARMIRLKDLEVDIPMPAYQVRMERVLVFVGETHETGHYADMFVDEFGADPKRLPVNERATRIYNNNWLVHRPGEPFPHDGMVHGTAVLFDDRVWF